MDSQPALRICPKCKKGMLETRVPRSPLIKLIAFWLPLKRYKCYHCNRKPYIRENKVP